MKLFHDTKASSLYRKLIAEMNGDEKTMFNLELARFRDKKIVSEDNLDTYYVTASDISIIAHNLKLI